MAKSFPIYKQFDSMDCGAACLRMIAKYHDRLYSLEYLRDITHVDREGISLQGVSEAAEHIGFQTLGVVSSYEQLLSEQFPKPCIAYWEQRHFVVVYKATKTQVTIGDPAVGLRTLTKEEFLEGWIAGADDNNTKIGVLLLLETTPDFYLKEGDEHDKRNLSYIISYFKKYKSLLVQLFLGLLVGSLLQVVFPFLMQAIVDVGIENQDVNFIYLILGAHLVLHISQMAIETIRSWIFLHIGTRINISLVSDYLRKLMNLPIRFFETKMTGDFIQRIYDNQRIEYFLTSTSLFSLFNLFNIIILGLVLAYFSLKIFIVYVFSTVLYLAWVLFFVQRRKELDFRQYDLSAHSQESLIQIINGMREIKMHNDENNRRWAWERLQAQIFRANVNHLKTDQWQRSGVKFINETKNIIITFLAAKAVIDGDMTLGMLVAIQYIVGQLSTPMEDFISFAKNLQDADLSMQRLGEIHDRSDEEDIEDKISLIPEKADLNLIEVDFQYGGSSSPKVIDGIDLTIPAGKTTAIVGASGSGKTTLLKLLLNIYQPTSGFIRLNDMNLTNVQNRIWRDRVGTVLQDSYIFSDTIGNNIAMGEFVRTDKRKLLYATKVAHIQDFIESLPLGYKTKIGSEGIGLSQGQLQRILIARAIYKNPDYFFFDEATNALDTTTERQVMKNLQQHFFNRTVVIVAHRMSTVRNADNIVVLDKGKVVEEGTHNELIQQKGYYYNLVQNQINYT